VRDRPPRTALGIPDPEAVDEAVQQDDPPTGTKEVQDSRDVFPSDRPKGKVFTGGQRLHTGGRSDFQFPGLNNSTLALT
jgi:hypothetical protein